MKQSDKFSYTADVAFFQLSSYISERRYPWTV
jgi:hypothetical protein